MKFTKKEKCIVIFTPFIIVSLIYSIGFRPPEFNPVLKEKVIPRFTDAQRINFRLKQQKTINFDKVDLSVSAFKGETWVRMARQKGVLKKGSISNKKFQIINWSE